jgi:hypothetical protein
MDFKGVLVILFAVFAIALMIFYFIPFNTNYFTESNGNDNFSIVPLNTTYFASGEGDNNFNIISGNESMQFYPNMRFPSTNISYRISNCPLQRQNDMEYGFEIIENLTPLRFYPVINNEEISVTCDEKNIFSEGLFIAGEGGPTNITAAGQLNVITHGEILLIKDSNCPMPNIAMHELFHVLGFHHSTNPQNIMYNVTSCEQTIGSDMIQLIDNLYSIPSYPDLAIQNVSASITGRFLNLNMTILNEGLADSGDFKVNIYADNNLIKEINSSPILIGYERIISIKNIFVTQLSVSELSVTVDSNFSEINKENNKINLEIK